MLRRLAPLLVTLAAVGASAKDAPGKPSLRFSCSEKPFLSVSVFTPAHDSFPHIQLGLIDPFGRNLSGGKQKAGDPKHRVGRVIELPKHPTRSRAVAAEVCGAVEGDYQLVVSERANAEYRLAVRVDDGGPGNEAMSASLLSRVGQNCTLRFRVSMRYHVVSVRWLTAEAVQTDLPDPVCESVGKH